MSDIMAAICIAQFKKIEQFSLRRRSLAMHYDAVLKNSKTVDLFCRNYDDIVPHIYVVLLKNKNIREKVRADLLNVGIQTGIHYTPNHLLSYFRTAESDSLPVTENMYPRLLTLPLHPDLTFDQVNSICNALEHSASTLS